MLGQARQAKEEARYSSPFHRGTRVEQILLLAFGQRSSLVMGICASSEVKPAVLGDDGKLLNEIGDNDMPPAFKKKTC